MATFADISERWSQFPSLRAVQTDRSTEYPGCWELELTASIEDEAGAEDGSDSEGDDAPQSTPNTSKNIPKVSHAYKEFLQFLELGCSGSPIQGYPAVLVILSTIPPSVCSILWSLYVTTSHNSDL